jgi:hypothetical protein
MDRPRRVAEVPLLAAAVLKLRLVQAATLDLLDMKRIPRGAGPGHHLFDRIEIGDE